MNSTHVARCVSRGCWFVSPSHWIKRTVRCLREASRSYIASNIMTASAENLYLLQISRDWSFSRLQIISKFVPFRWLFIIITRRLDIRSSLFWPHTLFVVFLRFSEERTITFPNSNCRFVSIVETQSVSGCELGTEIVSITWNNTAPCRTT